ncbi:DUF3291 domain-containing protein [Salipiger sp. P9]|uniref:DUF3291 domain-containing protein n=1 Tax=Salipiger pentaromativorans TaxID=2943193 RepID=UPI0021577D27|nr:DUF3291 domain-containing protein [Salipiger pentaromativorans]MCR8546262.1 DUF3291 domain-containing protein [Salipiger pentaromativorans]
MQPDGHHLAEFNLGVLKYDWDDPRVKDFVDGLDLVNGIAQRSAGFVWMMSGDEMEAEQLAPEGALGGNPRLASTLSVWEDAASLEHFVWNTVHKRFYDRKAEWYDAVDSLRLVMWWVPEGHRPTTAEAMARFRHLETHGDSAFAFGWAHLKEAELWKTKQCGEAA